MDVLIIFLSVPCYKAYPLHLLHLVLLLNTLKPKRRKAGKAAFTALCQSRTRLPPSAFLPHLFYTVGWQLGTLMSASLCLESVQVNWLMVTKSSLFSLSRSICPIPQDPWVTSALFCQFFIRCLPYCASSLIASLCAHIWGLFEVWLSPLYAYVWQRERAVCVWGVFLCELKDSPERQTSRKRQSSQWETTGTRNKERNGKSRKKRE